VTYNGTTIISSKSLELKLLKHSESCILNDNGYIISLIKYYTKYAQNGLVGTLRYIFMNNKLITFSRKSAPEKSARMVETIVGCKWSLTVYNLLNNDIHRPGEMVRSVEGLTTKVLNACLKRNIEFGILEREMFNEIPPRVEYKVTTFGHKFIKILTELEKLQAEIDDSNL
jgi:DNA-binding HxlR family transcriptional regulator